MELEVLELEGLISTAYHEAGHAVVALVLGAAIEKIEIFISKEDDAVDVGGRVILSGERSEFFKYHPLLFDCIINIAGKVSTNKYCDSQNWSIAKHSKKSVDIDGILMKDMHLASGLSKKEEKNYSFVSKCFAEWILDDPKVWGFVKALAIKVAKKRIIKSDELYNIFQSYISESDLSELRTMFNFLSRKKSTN